MKICKKEKTDTNGVKDESLCKTLCDMFRNLKCKDQCMMFIFSLLFTLCLFFFLKPSVVPFCSFNHLIGLYLSVFPSTLGLSIAAYAIILSSTSDKIKILAQKCKKISKAFHVICASMIFNGLLQTLTIMISLVYLLSKDLLLFFISTLLACYSLLQIMDILLHLLSFRTFIIPKK